MGVDFSKGAIHGEGFFVPATVPLEELTVSHLYPKACEHIATVTTPRWPVIHPNPVDVGDEVTILPPILVTECVTCHAHVNLEDQP